MVDSDFRTSHLAVRALITDRNDSILLGLRSSGLAVGSWALIGGKVDSKENEEKAITREVREETGLNFQPQGVFCRTEDTDSLPGQRWLTPFYYGTASGRLVIQREEILKVRYISGRYLEDLSIAFNHKQVLRNYFAWRQREQEN